MSNLIRTSITIPEDIYQSARMIAAAKRISVSKLIAMILTHEIHDGHDTAGKDPFALLGKYKLGLRKAYESRSDMYDKHLENRTKE